MRFKKEVLKWPTVNWTINWKRKTSKMEISRLQSCLKVSNLKVIGTKPSTLAPYSVYTKFQVYKKHSSTRMSLSTAMLPPSSQRVQTIASKWRLNFVLVSCILTTVRTLLRSFQVVESRKVVSEVALTMTALQIWPTGKVSSIKLGEPQKRVFCKLNLINIVKWKSESSRVQLAKWIQTKKIPTRKTNFQESFRRTLKTTITARSQWKKKDGLFRGKGKWTMRTKELKWLYNPWTRIACTGII